MSNIAIAHRAAPEKMLAGRLSSDERLAQLASRGSSRAFGVLYERHHRALYGYCRSIVRNDEDAQDALQSAITRALAALQASDRDIAVRPWLFRIVHNEAISLLRRRRPEDRPLDEREPAPVDVAHTVESRERLATLVADIQTLGERQRAALLMRELSGLSMDEIAAALSTSPAAAKQALFEARCALHELAEGRAMECDVVRRTLSERDGRVLRGRKLRAHLRACASCVQFRTLIEARSADLRALVPPVPAIGLLAHTLDLGGGQAGEAVAASTAAFAGPAAAALIGKGLAGAVIVTAAATSASGVVRPFGHPVAPPPRTSHAAPAQQPAALAPQLPSSRASERPAGDAPLPPPARRRQVAADGALGSVTDVRVLEDRTPRSAPSTTVPVPPSSDAEAAPPAPDRAAAPGAGTTTSPGKGKADGPPGRSSRATAKPDKGPKPPPPGNPHAESPAGAPAPPAPQPATPGPPSGAPGHSQDAHGNAPQHGTGAGHRPLSIVVRIPLGRLLS